MDFDLRRTRDLAKRLYYSVTDEVRLLVTRFWGRDCNTVCPCLGPYRNLTTLTGSILFLHPNVQVLNHAGRRIFGKDRLDFLASYSDDRLRRFTRFAIQVSAGGEKAEWGGSIMHSHAFERSGELRSIFRRSNMRRVKENIDCLFWKESLRVTKHIRESEENVENIIGSNDTVRFLMPIRNPMDCAKSNLKTGHHLLFPGIDGSSTDKDVLTRVLEEISWYADLRHRFPERTFHFFEYDLSEEMLGELADFLGIERDETWMDNALSVMKSTSHYDHSEDFVRFYKECLERLSFRDESIREGLTTFCR